MNFLTNIDLNKNQLMNASLHTLAVPPTSPVEGQIYFDTGQKRSFIWNGTEWEGTDALDAKMTGKSIVTAINSTTEIISNENLSIDVRTAITNSHSKTHTIGMVTGLQGALDDKVNNSRVKTDVPKGAIFTDTETSINGKTGVIQKEDIVALGIPAQDTVIDISGKQDKLTAGDNITITNDTISATDTVYDDASIQTELGKKADKTYVDNKVKTDVPLNAKFTDTIVDISGKVDKIAGKGLSTNDYTTTEKDKLEGIMSGANKYTHPENHPASMITESATKRFVTDTEKSTWNDKETPEGASSKASTAENNANNYTDTAVANLIGSAPEVLDTFHEIATALGNDPNFASSMMTELAKKTDKYVSTLGATTSQVVTHNLNSRDVTVSIRETGTPYAQVYTDIEFTSLDTITVKFAKAPTAGKYSVTVVG